MAVCIVINGTTGALEVGSPGCTGTDLMVMTAQELADYSASPLNLSTEDGYELAFLIIGVWTVALLTLALLRAIDWGRSSHLEEV